jgi:hypothetical protein
MRITSAGDVGIGTVAPQARFTVGVGNMALSTLGVGLTGSAPATGTQKLILGGNSANGVGNEIGWYPNTSFSGDIAQITAIATAFGVSSAGAMVFRTNGGAGATPAERMRLDSNGSLGIGTTTAVARLHTNGGASGINAVFESNTSADTRIEFRNNATRAGYLYWDANEVRLLADPTRAVTLFTNGVERMRVDNAGAVVLPKLTLSTDTPFLTGANINSGANPLAIGTTSTGVVALFTNNTERLRVKTNGQVRFIPLAAAPGSPEAGDVYYDSTTNKLRCYNGTTWNDLF